MSAVAASREGAAIRRIAVGESCDDRLFFAQVREDPRLELSALAAHLDGPIAVVASGGCTALSLVAVGATDVTAVDLNRTQNHVVELKAVALAELGPAGALGFLGGVPQSARARATTYGQLRPGLGRAARAYWDGRPGAVAQGVLGAGVTERFMAGLARAVRGVVHPRRRIDALLACETVAEQRELYDRSWDTRRWRALFALLCNRFVLRRTYDPGFFSNVGRPSFARHFHDVVEHTLTELPVRDNYFLHHVLRGTYPAAVDGAVPPYLSSAGAVVPGEVRDRLTIVDAAFVEYLRSCADSSIAGFSLSNICEWLTEAEIGELFAEIARTARPGARLCFRNFVGWTEVPASWRSVIREDIALGNDLIDRDRSLCQRRIAVCDIVKEDR
jgi:S-adenosylmethionine-diacylglycerol 3-amino-3-carboxypropyl transferase